MADHARRARDLGLLDALDAFRREVLALDVWRLVRAERDPTMGSPSQSRWCNGAFDVLYASLDRNDAIAEIHALLSMQPVFPSKDRWFAYKLRVATAQTLRLATMDSLAKLGVDTARYANRDYGRTQDIADAAFFLGYDGLIAPSARSTGLNLALFTERVLPDRIEVIEASDAPIDWEAWRKRARK